MIRRIIKQGNNSYTLTLPIKWIRQNNLRGNEEIHIDEIENELKIHAKPNIEKKSIILNVSENNEKSIRFLIQQVYRQNYDQFSLNYKTEETFKTINKIIDSYFVGLEIIEKHKDRCTVSVIVETTEEKFHLFLRKIFRIILDSLNLLKTNDKENKELIHYNYLKLYSYQNYGKRYLYTKKSELSSYDYYSLLSYFLNIHSDIDQLSRCKSSNSIDKSYDLLNKLVFLFEQIEKNFYLKKIDALMHIPEEMQDIKKEIQCIKIPKISKEEFLSLHYQMEVSRLIYGAVSPLLGILLYETDKFEFNKPA